MGPDALSTSAGAAWGATSGKDAFDEDWLWEAEFARIQREAVDTLVSFGSR